MDEVLPLAPGVGRLTVNLDEDDVALFEDLWPVPHGVALHAYLIEGQRRVIVDPWNAGGYGAEEVEADLKTHGLSWKDIHAVAFTKEPNAALLLQIREFQPALESWGTPSTAVSHDLGGIHLQEKDGFWFVPEAGVLLSGDTFAGLGWIEDQPWADELSADAARHANDEALRWFCFRPLCPPALVEGTRFIAPAHGSLWRSKPHEALERAQRFAGWGAGPGLDEITVVWPAGPEFDDGLDTLVRAALDEGAGLNLFRVPGDELTALAAGARRASLVVVAEGLDTAFLNGMDKDVWRPAARLGDHLGDELAARWSTSQ